MSKQRVTVRVPASTANLGAGFDTIGLAFQLYTTITMSIADQTTIRLVGSELASLPQDKTNLLYKVAAFLFEKASLPAPELSIEVETEVPLTRGLGSSAAAVVGALVAANTLAGKPYTDEQLFTIASRWEGHPDNVGASQFGGLIVSALPDNEDEQVPYAKFSVPERLKTLVVIPDFELPTHQARKALPDQYSREDAVYNISRASLLVAAFSQDRLDLLATAMQDRLHQPYRTALVPGLSEIVEKAKDYGALGAALSGAGPTILCFFENDQAEQRLVQFIEQVMLKNQLSYSTMVLLPDDNGVIIDTSPVYTA
ncbi:homoserine kinase [Brevibacillus laterosporus]|uniref:Homoserine kinase n=1 Tax=Brevibacillus laterosporus TaxID=1465 RepID=A0AAP3DCY0_BRELA|nr:homoserine kinase [Brevibacillus laterosporus]MCR8978802.1 homoserine kinase [Brevibacillus laterosporus]MCZ0805958.1 homoserine kinase [Brevibacillus laterosporus]MCZ0824295.1 homoserine kinase [Brevibacillus laterosporus]MCZ0848202.1 homoserine kinase [Brevibacillus laterosporus]MED1664428.1 homoserine kinase [Brevibacillus laterosporus]